MVLGRRRLTQQEFVDTFDEDAAGDGAALRSYVVYTTSAAVFWWFGDRAREMRR